MIQLRTFAAPTLLLVVLGAGACSGNMMNADTTQLAAVHPAGGAVGVSVNTVVRIEFTHAMMTGMEAYAALHEVGVTGPVVAGTWSWSQGMKVLTFTPAVPLAPNTQYTIHLGGAMLDRAGHMTGLQHHGSQLGGHMATGSMMSGMGSSMMGSGWQHPNGTYGMIFSFTTS